MRTNFKAATQATKNRAMKREYDRLLNVRRNRQQVFFGADESPTPEKPWVPLPDDIRSYAKAVEHFSTRLRDGAFVEAGIINCDVTGEKQDKCAPWSDEEAIVRLMNLSGIATNPQQVGACINIVGLRIEWKGFRAQMENELRQALLTITVLMPAYPVLMRSMWDEIRVYHARFLDYQAAANQVGLKVNAMPPLPSPNNPLADLAKMTKDMGKGIGDAFTGLALFGAVVVGFLVFREMRK